MNKTPSGRIISSGKVALLQFAFRDSEKNIHVLLVRIRKKMPAQIINFLNSNHFTFVGCNIRSDLTRLSNDYKLEGEFVDSVNICDVQTLAHSRDVVPRRKSKLDFLVKEVLHVHLPKPNSIRCSDWNGKD